MPEQPVPDVSPTDVARVVRRDFGPDLAVQAMAIVEQLGEEARQSPRVQLAVLKLAEGDLAALRYYTEEAKKDFRDVLASAEYPRYMKDVPMKGRVPADEETRIIEDDRRQYQSWLSR